MIPLTMKAPRVYLVMCNNKLRKNLTCHRMMSQKWIPHKNVRECMCECVSVRVCECVNWGNEINCHLVYRLMKMMFLKPGYSYVCYSKM